jgi:hypothetical protein
MSASLVLIEEVAEYLQAQILPDNRFVEGGPKFQH